MPPKRSSSDLNNLPKLAGLRSALRKNMTPAEAAFWTIAKVSQIDGRKFRRQHSAGPYILDFYCPAERLAVELDGDIHFNEEAEQRDRERKRYLDYYGIKVIRFENRQVFQDPEGVIDIIRRHFGWWEKERRENPFHQDYPRD
jgi:very-short-patch-repair endonuclease